MCVKNSDDLAFRNKEEFRHDMLFTLPFSVGLGILFIILAIILDLLLSYFDIYINIILKS